MSINGPKNQSEWIVYALLDQSHKPFYVGATNNAKRRMKEHRSTLGYTPAYKVLQTGHDPIERAIAERCWISQMRALGVKLSNRSCGGNGAWRHCNSTRLLLSQLGKGRPKTEEHKAKIAASNKGRQRNWSVDGHRNVQQTQFQKGEHKFSQWSADAQQRIREASRKQWIGISPEERSRRATERNLRAWANRDPEDRAAIGRKIAAANRRHRESAA